MKVRCQTVKVAATVMIATARAGAKRHHTFLFLFLIDTLAITRAASAYLNIAFCIARTCHHPVQADKMFMAGRGYRVIPILYVVCAKLLLLVRKYLIGMTRQSRIDCRKMFPKIIWIE